MKVKRFVAPTMRQALREIRDEMGPDAVILSNRRVSGGVELLTALESDAAEQSEPSPAPAPAPAAPSRLERELERMQQDARQRAQALAARFAQPEPVVDETPLAANATPDEAPAAEVPRPSPASSPQPPVTAAASSDELAVLRFELQSMRDLLERQMAGMAWREVSRESPARASLWQGLKRIGLPATVARRLLDSVNEGQPVKAQWQQLMRSLTAAVPVVSGDPVAAGGCFAFLGPAGAGKTTTIGKLATRYVLANGADDIALVSTDNYRIAGQEQLRTLGRILNVPVRFVDQQHSLDQLLYALRHKKLVLIDTPGLGQQEPALARLRQMINEQGSRLQSLLVLPATSQARVLQAAWQNYQVDSLAGCVLTKLDETASLGDALGLLIDRRLPLAYVSDGQDIPHAIGLPDPAGLVSQAIALGKSAVAGPREMVDEMAALQQQERLAAVE